MPSYHWNIDQGSEAWDNIRAGKWSASKAAVIMGGLDTKGLNDLIMDVAWGRLYGPIEHSSYKSAAMERGNNLESGTRERYQFQTDRVISQCGFVEHSTVPHVGWSPDGLEDGAVIRHAIEAKNPLHKAYMEVCKTGKIPSEYRWQTKWGMWVGELDSMDFLCDHPKAKLIVLPCEVSALEKEQLEARVYMLEKRVAEWTETLLNRKSHV